MLQLLCTYVLGLTSQKSVCDTTADYVGL